MSAHDRFDELVPAYVLGTLDDEERRTFDAHVAECAECQRTVEELRRVAVGVGLASAAPPPPDLRAKVLRRATTQPQLSASFPGGASTVREQPRVTPPRSGGWMPVALAASVLLAAVAGLYAASLRGQVSRLSQLVQQASAQLVTLRAELAAARLDSTRLTHTLQVIGAPDVLRVEMRGQASAPAAKGRAYISRSAGLIVSLDGLPPLQTGRTYELWVVPAGASSAPIGIGTFGVDRTGGAALTVPLPAGVTAAAIAVTNEPSGGSQTPTVPILVVGAAANPS